MTRWQDVRTVSLDQRTFSSWRGGIMLRDFPDDLLAAQRETITAMEPARHAAHRKPLSARVSAMMRHQQRIIFRC